MGGNLHLYLHRNNKRKSFAPKDKSVIYKNRQKMRRTLYRYKILSEKGTVKKLAMRFGVSEQTVRAALRFATANDLSDTIRHTAIRDYGSVLMKRPVFSVDTKID